VCQNDLKLSAILRAVSGGLPDKRAGAVLRLSSHVGEASGRRPRRRVWTSRCCTGAGQGDSECRGEGDGVGGEEGETVGG
jgi:hypothetical protein